MTFWADISSYQSPLSDSYPYPFVAFKITESNNFVDPHAQQNLSWAKAKRSSGRLAGFLCYHVYRDVDVASQVAAIQSVTGPVPGMAIMIDAETWGGELSGNHSAHLNDLVARLRSAGYGVCGYGNRYDLASMWPNRPKGLPLIIAAYTSDLLSEPGQVGQQYYGGVANPVPSGFPTSCPPFGSNVDLNYSPLSASALAAAVSGGEAPQGGGTPLTPDPVPLVIKETDMLTLFQVADGTVNAGRMYAVHPTRAAVWLSPTDLQTEIGFGHIANPDKPKPVLQVQIDRHNAFIAKGA